MNTKTTSWLDTQVLISIEDAYSSDHCVMFKLENLCSMDVRGNAGKTVLLQVSGMGELCPHISYSDFSRFLKYVFTTMYAIQKKWHLFEIRVEKDLSIKWRDFSHAAPR